MSNERRDNTSSNFWRNVATGVGVAAAGAVLAYFVSEAVDHNQERNNSERSWRGGSGDSPRRRRRSSSTGTSNKGYFSELRRNISDKLNSGTYECMICLEEITKTSEIISCKTCFQISHLSCLRTHVSHSRDEGKSPGCPTCRSGLPYNLIYKCFCEKKVNPLPMEGLTPHSCGKVCGKDNCNLICHPGPCP